MVRTAMELVIPSASSTHLQSSRVFSPIFPAPQAAYPVKRENPKLMALESTPLLSPGSVLTNFTAWAQQIQALRSDEGREIDAQAVNELLEAMKHTVSVLADTFDVLGNQTAKVGQLGPAIDVAYQVCVSLQIA